MGHGSVLKTAALIAVIALAATLPAQAARFANQFTEFELPPQWQCNIEDAEWVCNHVAPAKQRDALIVLAAKMRGDNDTIEKFHNHLLKPKTYTSVQGKAIVAQVKYAEKIAMDGQLWVDALHLNSEIPNYVTRYLATVKNDIAVLITWSIHKDKVSLYQKDFEALFHSLKVFRKQILADADHAKTAPDAPKISVNLDPGTVFGGAGTIPSEKQEKPDNEKRQKPDSGDSPLIPILIGLAALAAFAFWKKKHTGG